MNEIAIIAPAQPNAADERTEGLPRQSLVARLPWPIIAPIGLFLLTCAAFLPAIMSEYVYWDDDDLLINTVIWRQLDSQSLRWMFTTSYSGHFQPLTWLSYWLDWTIWRREVSGYHLTNVLLHAGSAVMLYYLIRRLIRSGLPHDASEAAIGDTAITMAAAFAAALFSVHPLRVESVAWLAERRDVLGGFFFTASVSAYVRWRQMHGAASTRGWYWLALFLQCLSLLAKASAMSLPFVLLLLDLYPLRSLAHRPWRQRAVALVWDKTPFFVLAIAGGLRAWAAQVEAGAFYPLWEYDVLSRVSQVLYGLAFYPWKTLVPIALSPLYQLPTRDVLVGSLLWKGLLGTALLLVVAMLARKRMPVVTLSISLFVVLIAPVSGVFQSGPQLVADRYSYLSCIGFAALPAVGLLALMRTRVWRLQSAASVTALLCALCLTGLFQATVAQSKVWATALDLWGHAVKVTPESSIVHANYADALMTIENVPQAAHHYRRALQIQPRDAIAAHHFGEALARLGEPKAAEALFLYSIRLNPWRPRVYVSLARLLVDGGRANEAVALLRNRVEQAPKDLAAGGLLADLLATHPDEHVRDGCEASDLASHISAQLGHQNARALLTWSSAKAENGEWEEALTIARRGLAIAWRERQEALTREFQYRIELFEQQLPYRYELR